MLRRRNTETLKNIAVINKCMLKKDFATAVLPRRLRDRLLFKID